MSSPSFSNIDRWLFDLVEGNLSPQQEEQLRVFLMQHPELDVDKDMWELARIEKEEVVYPNKENLIKKRPVGFYLGFGALGFALISAVSLVVFYPNNTAQERQITADTSMTGLKQTKMTAKTVQQPQKNQAGILLADHASTRLIRGDYDQQQVFVSQTTGEVSPAFNSVNTDELQEVYNLNLLPFRQTSYSFKKSISGENKSPDFVKKTHKRTLNDRFNTLSRKVQRMMNNPVALKNSRDPYFHVPGMTATDVNFAAVGTMLTNRVQLLSRYQWPSKENQQLMNELTLDGYSYALRGGYGVQFKQNTYGKNGGIENYQASFIYSPKFAVNKMMIIEPAIKFQMGNKKLNTSALAGSTMTEYDRGNAMMLYPDGQKQIGSDLWYKDMGAGVMVNTKWFFAGIQVDNLFRHYDNVYTSDLTDQRRIGRQLIISAGTDYESRKHTSGLSPYIVYHHFENLSEGWFGLNSKVSWLTVGGAISNHLNFAASIGVKFKHFSLVYNADKTYSSILGSKVTSHQLSLRIITKPSRTNQRLLNL